MVPTTMPTARSNTFRTAARGLAARGVAALGLAATLIAGSATARAAEVTVDAAYGATIGGFPIGAGTLSFSVARNGEYAASIGAQVTGLAALIANRQATATTAGRALYGGQISPKAYMLDIAGGPVPNHVEMALANNAVTNVSASEIRIPGWERRTPVTPAHKRGIVDPLGAFVISAGKARDPLSAEVCNRTVKVFDGRARYDLHMIYGAKTEVKGEPGSYSGPALICAVAYRPIAGFRPLSQAELEYERNIEFSIVFVPVASTNILIPHKVVIGTPSGKLVVTASRFKVSGATRTAEARGEAARSDDGAER